MECSPAAHTPNGVNGAAVSAPLPPVLRRRNNLKPEHQQKVQFRRSLINIDDATQDDELDAILGELSVLGSQLESEIDQKLAVAASAAPQPAEERTKQGSPAESSGNSDDNSFSSGVHSRSSSGEGSQIPTKPVPARTNGKRTDSPDNDSAFCDNLSVLSSCSSSSKLESKTSSSGVSSSTSPSTALAPNVSVEDEEARIKAEKIKLAIEKIKEANVKKIFVKVFAADGSAKSLLVDEKMSVGHVTRILAEKNHVKLDPKWAIVELIPELYMERVYEDHENLVENCLMWKVDSKNTLWFIERPEKFDLFIRPELYLLGSSSSQKGDLMEEHARQELLEEYFSSSGVGAPEGVEGFLWLKSESKKSWKKFFFVLRSSGLYYAPKGKKSSKDLICLATFDVNQVYYGSNWKKKYKSPTDYCFAIKHPQIQAKSPKYTRYLCVESERELHQWVTAIRIAKNGKGLYDNYRGIEEEITHADIDILTSKRFSVNSPSSGGKQQQQPTSLLPVITSEGRSGSDNSPARTPMSENKSFDSALSSGIVSDDVIDENDVTPVNTIQRPTSNQVSLRRSVSRSSKSSTSSSSGCLSDKSSGSGQPYVPSGLALDQAAGGGIWQWFSGGWNHQEAANPCGAAATIDQHHLGPAVTRDSDNEENDNDENSSASCSGDSTSNSNVRIGGGGTLLRSAVRQSLRKTSTEYGTRQVQAMVHKPEVDPMSQQFENSMMITSISEELPLPPPPRAESMQQFQAQHDVDDLPPPPPPEICDQIQKTSSMKQPGDQPKPKRISFDDNVQLIPESPAPKTRYFFQREVYSANPKKLFSQNPATATNLSTPPREFLKDLQRVMTKKWQVAEKCKETRQPNGHFASPHQVLGFRDPDQLGCEQTYNRDESVGAWILQTQQYTVDPRPVAEPLYAVCQKKPDHVIGHVTNTAANHQQMFNGNGIGGPGLPPHHPNANPGHARQHHMPDTLPSIRSNVPVVLREPTPEYEVIRGRQTAPDGVYGTYMGQNTYQDVYYQSQQPRGGQKRAPPPPRRSETTQLSTKWRLTCAPPPLLWYLWTRIDNVPF